MILATSTRFLSYVACTVCFLVLAYQSIIKYIDKPTSVSVTYSPVKTQKFPSLVFCPDTPYIPNTNWSVDATKFATPMPKVTFKDLYFTENQSQVLNDPYRYTSFDTVYSGRCQLLESDLEVNPGTYVKLIAEEKEATGSPLWLYVYYPGHEVQMMYQVWSTSSVAVVQLRRSATISIFAEKFEYLQDVDGLDCKGEDIGGEAACLKQEVKRALEEKGFSCLPTHFRFLPDMKTEFCKAGQESIAKDALVAGLDVTDEVKSLGTCKAPCHTITYRLKTTEINHIPGFPLGGYNDEGQRVFYLNLPSKTSITRKQYYIHDQSSVLSALGGGLGLFLGLSCLGGALSLINMICKRLPTLEKQTKLNV